MTISFSYNLKEYKRHGEAASADLDTAEEERKQVSEILAPYAKRDRWNVDESGLFCTARSRSRFEADKREEIKQVLNYCHLCMQC